MLAIQLIALGIGIALFVALAAISLHGQRKWKRKRRDGGPVVPMHHHHFSDPFDY